MPLLERGDRFSAANQEFVRRAGLGVIRDARYALAELLLQKTAGDCHAAIISLIRGQPGPVLPHSPQIRAGRCVPAETSGPHGQSELIQESISIAGAAA
jgi:hypothetical protein